MTSSTKLTQSLIDAAIGHAHTIVKGLDPVDWIQMELIANLPIEKRLSPGLSAQAFAMSALRGTLLKRYPELSLSEINMKVLSHFTTVRMVSK